MQILDTNMVLRYLLNDNRQMASCLLEFLSEVSIPEEQVVRLGLETYAGQNLVFVDCILYAYNRVKGYEIRTFDKKLQRLLEVSNK